MQLFILSIHKLAWFMLIDKLEGVMRAMIFLIMLFVLYCSFVLASGNMPVMIPANLNSFNPLIQNGPTPEIQSFVVREGHIAKINIIEEVEIEVRSRKIIEKSL